MLVLDDYHVISDRGVQESLEFLISYLPPTTQLVIASRWDPPLPLARMRARGELLELRAEDLRFSLDETAAMVSALSEHRTGRRSGDGTLAADRGLGGRAAAGGSEPAGQSGSGSGGRPGTRRRPAPLRLLHQRGAPVLAAEHRDLLVRAAALDLLSGSLCDAALQVQGSANVLAELERGDLFVVAVDAERQWYRCHRLLRDALLRGPHAQSEAATREVLLRAAQWFAEHDRIDEAVGHRQRAGDDEGAAALLQAQDTWFFDRGWAATYLAHGERLAESVIEPQLALPMAYAAKISGRPDRIVHWLDVCDRQIDDDTVIAGWRSARAAAVMMRGINGTPPDDPAQAVALCEQAVALEAAAGTEQHPGRAGFVGQRVRLRRAVRGRRADPG